MRWWSIGALEIGFRPGHLIVAVFDGRWTRMLVDWVW